MHRDFLGPGHSASEVFHLVGGHYHPRMPRLNGMNGFYWAAPISVTGLLETGAVCAPRWASIPKVVGCEPPSPWCGVPGNNMGTKPMIPNLGANISNIYGDAVNTKHSDTYVNAEQKEEVVHEYRGTKVHRARNLWFLGDLSTPVSFRWAPRMGSSHYAVYEDMGVIIHDMGTYQLLAFDVMLHVMLPHCWDSQIRGNDLWQKCDR